MSTIGDRIRLRRTTGRRGETRYSLRETERSRNIERQQGNSEQNDQEIAPEGKETTVPRRECENLQFEVNANLQDLDRSRSRSADLRLNSRSNVERSRCRLPRRVTSNRRQRSPSHRGSRVSEQVHTSSRRALSEISGNERRSSRYHPYSRGLSWWDNIDREVTDPLPFSAATASVPQPNNPFLSNRGQPLRISREVPRYIHDRSTYDRDAGAERSNDLNMVQFSNNHSFQFPTEQNSSFARAMSAIACNAEVGAQGKFNLVSGGNDNFKEYVSQALALKLNLKTTQQENEKAF